MYKSFEAIFMILSAVTINDCVDVCWNDEHVLYHRHYKLYSS